MRITTGGRFEGFQGAETKKGGKTMKDTAQTETKSLITKLFEIMRNDLGVMAEHDDSEESLLEELNNASKTLLEAYEGLYIN